MKFYNNWIMNRGKGIFFCNNHIFKNAYLFSIPNFRIIVVSFIYTIRDKCFSTGFWSWKISLQKTSHYLFRTHLNIFAELISVVLQNTTSTFTGNHLSVFLYKDLPIFLKTNFSNFSEHLPLRLQSTYTYIFKKISSKTISVPVKYIVSFLKGISQL